MLSKVILLKLLKKSSISLIDYYNLIKTRVINNKVASIIFINHFLSLKNIWRD